VGEGPAGAVGSRRKADLAEGETATRGTRRVHGSTRTNNSFQIKAKEWWRRGESEYSGVLKTHKLLIFRGAQNVENGEIGPNWNVSGTRVLSSAKRNSDFRVTFISELPIVRPKPRISLPTTPFLDNLRLDDNPEAISRVGLD
jgi:hypothetical protein